MMFQIPQEYRKRAEIDSILSIRLVRGLQYRRLESLPVHTPMSMILSIIRMLPTRTRTLDPLASKIGPTKMPQRKVKAMYMLKIHPVELSL